MKTKCLMVATIAGLLSWGSQVLAAEEADFLLSEC